MIISAELYYDLLVDERMKLSEDGPTLQQTVFGWVVSGRVPGRLVSGAKTHSHSCATADIRDLLTRFWELDSCHSRSTYSPEESACKDLFARTTTRDEDGKYVVTLPIKDYLLKQLGESKSIALKRFLGLEERFELKPEWKAQYKDFIDEYLKLGHMRPTTEEAEPSPAYYLPHHAVIKPDSLTTKLRVVYDASCKTSTGISLNDALMVGPVVQEDLLSISIRFRFHRIAVVADVEKMYRMVKVDPHDQHLQRILWRNTPDEPIGTYELTTVTYGTASAPYLATRCLAQLGSEGAATHQRAAKALKEDFYVDDMLTGADSIEDGKLLIREMRELTDSRGFSLRKWASNERGLLAELPNHLLDERIMLELDSSSSHVKTLGLLWEPRTDSFLFCSPNWNNNPPITKRIVLADAARLFDPLGLIGPVVVQAKIFLQQLWKQKTDWDEPLNEELQSYWLEYRRNLMTLNSFSIPRWTGYSRSKTELEIHGFCDASEAAYGACIYLRSTSVDGTITTRLVTSKSKVAPLEDLSRKKKKQSIPRLKLSSALTLSHLYEKVCSSIQSLGDSAHN
ncbi:uncharacterized protein LOC129720225 [Wyeomyia smithii]|uniref:uncharacterized protein LOC129720225 n=1 Tax=Wyeomyia smithii TaxID=174621 RepID=UPI002467D9FC|nr:uncharacterized protein LOC129720225 [Wyeomyia smithii]